MLSPTAYVLANWILQLPLLVVLSNLAALIPNVVLGILLFLNYWFGCFLFAGVLVATNDVVWPLRACCYAFPLRWTLRSMSYLEVSEWVGGGVGGSSKLQHL